MLARIKDRLLSVASGSFLSWSFWTLEASSKQPLLHAGPCTVLSFFHCSGTDFYHFKLFVSGLCKEFGRTKVSDNANMGTLVDFICKIKIKLFKVSLLKARRHINIYIYLILHTVLLTGPRCDT